MCTDTILHANAMTPKHMELRTIAYVTHSRTRKIIHSSRRRFGFPSASSTNGHSACKVKPTPPHVLCLCAAHSSSDAVAAAGLRLGYSEQKQQQRAILSSAMYTIRDSACVLNVCACVSNTNIHTHTYAHMYMLTELLATRVACQLLRTILPDDSHFTNSSRKQRVK